MSSTIESLIPHRAPMCWIDNLIECTDTTAVATARFDAGHFAAGDGFVLEVALVECVAQTVAAALGQRALSTQPSSRPGAGMLTAVTGFVIQAPPPLGRTLRIEVCELKRLGPMLRVSGVVSCDGAIIASGELSLYA